MQCRANDEAKAGEPTLAQNGLGDCGAAKGFIAMKHHAIKMVHRQQTFPSQEINAREGASKTERRSFLTKFKGSLCDSYGESEDSSSCCECTCC